MKHGWIGVSMVGMSLIACGGSDLSEQEVRAAWQSAETVAQSGVDPYSPNTALTVAMAAASQQFSATVPCNGGGQAAFSGQVSASETGSQFAGSFNVNVTYAQCNHNGHSINGTLTYQFDATGSGSGNSGTVSVNLIYASDGPLELDGIGCEVDFTANLSVSGSGNDYSLDYGYTGSICGYSAEGVFAVSGVS